MRESSHSSSSSKRSCSRRVTDEEISEYLVKKAMSIAKKLKPQVVSAYSNDSNPFGDSNLNETFVWRKKIEQKVAQGLPLPDIISVKAETKRRRERKAELENARKSREERAMKKARREEEAAMLARDSARAEAQEWEKKEQVFFLDQSRIKSRVRLQQGRAKPIDILNNYLNLSEVGLEENSDCVEINKPSYMVFDGLTLTEIEELHGEIKMNLELDRATPTRIEFWAALMVVCEWELAEAQKKAHEKPPTGHGGLHASIEADVKNQLQVKNYKELEMLQSQIESQMRSGTAKVVEYWEVVLKLIYIYKARAYLKELHTTNLSRSGHVKDPLKSEKHFDPSLNNTQSPEPLIDEVEINEAGSFSPQLLQGDENEEATEPAEDLFELEQKRKSVLDQKIAMKALGAMEEGDALFGSNAEVNLDAQVYWWHDKYRPRKPKYFNRVHTGYVWNKYNQTHYDHDNPPPKTVQGYKFNIFYPDLVDQSKIPEYKIEMDKSNEGTCIIRFHAGAPYEDIAFRVVHREWDYSRKKGFKCTFERGMLQLYFNFKRCPYRRWFLTNLRKTLFIFDLLRRMLQVISLNLTSSFYNLS